jgi:hypothetical protein
MNWTRIAIAGWLALTLADTASAQAGSNAAASRRVAPAVAARPDTALDPGGALLREIDDPFTGNLWLLVRDPERPAGPGRWVLAGQRIGTQQRDETGPMPLVPATAPQVIHAGDALLVEEHTPLADTRLEAVALGSAVKGACLRARLKIGGKVVKVEAISPGHAAFGPESKVEP